MVSTTVLNTVGISDGIIFRSGGYMGFLKIWNGWIRGQKGFMWLCRRNKLGPLLFEQQILSSPTWLLLRDSSFSLASLDTTSGSKTPDPTSRRKIVKTEFLFSPVTHAFSSRFAVPVKMQEEKRFRREATEIMPDCSMATGKERLE